MSITQTLAAISEATRRTNLLVDHLKRRCGDNIVAYRENEKRFSHTIAAGDVDMVVSFDFSNGLAVSDVWISIGWMHRHNQGSSGMAMRHATDEELLGEFDETYTRNLEYALTDWQRYVDGRTPKFDHGSNWRTRTRGKGSKTGGR